MDKSPAQLTPTDTVVIPQETKLEAPGLVDFYVTRHKPTTPLPHYPFTSYEFDLKDSLKIVQRAMDRCLALESEGVSFNKFINGCGILVFFWLFVLFRYTGNKRMHLNRLIADDEQASLLAELIAKVNKIIPGYNWKAITRDPGDKRLGLMVIVMTLSWHCIVAMWIYNDVGPNVPECWRTGKRTTFPLGWHCALATDGRQDARNCLELCHFVGGWPKYYSRDAVGWLLDTRRPRSGKIPQRWDCQVPRENLWDCNVQSWSRDHVPSWSDCHLTFFQGC